VLVSKEIIALLWQLFQSTFYFYRCICTIQDKFGFGGFDGIAYLLKLRVETRNTNTSVLCEVL